MARHVRDIMTADPVTVEPQTSVAEVARLMRDEDLGVVPVTDGDDLRGVVTDRDLVVRCLSRGGDPEQTTVAGACSDELVTVARRRTSGRPWSRCVSTPCAGSRSSATGTPSASSPWATWPWNATRSRARRHQRRASRHLTEATRPTAPHTRPVCGAVARSGERRDRHEGLGEGVPASAPVFVRLLPGDSNTRGRRRKMMSRDAHGQP